MDAPIATDFAALIKYFIGQPDTQVVGLISYDLEQTTGMHKSLLFGRDDMGTGSLVSDVWYRKSRIRPSSG
jgi:hypothetical protein